MRLRVSLNLVLALVLAACAAPVPAPTELRSVAGETERVHVSERGTRPSLVLLLRGDSTRYTTPLPPAWDEEADVSAACAGAPVSMRVDGRGEIWEISCRGRQLFSYRDKASLNRGTWEMGTNSFLVVLLVVAGIVWLVLRAQRRRGAE